MLGGDVEALLELVERVRPWKASRQDQDAPPFADTPPGCGADRAIAGCPKLLCCMAGQVHLDIMIIAT